VERDLAFGQFPDCRVFSVRDRRFVEFNRGTGNWIEVTYDTIMGAVPTV
jgi:hypothetical protein